MPTMNEELKALKKSMSELADEELLLIVEQNYADYRPDALNCAKQELTARGIPFNETPLEAAAEEEPVYQELFTVAAFSIPYQAHLAKGLLEANGIAAHIADEFTVSVNWLYSNAIGGVKVQVAEADVEEARRILADKESGEITEQTEIMELTE